MEKLLNNKWFWAKMLGFVLLAAIAFKQTYFYTLPENKPFNYDYDEAMWTGASIASYYMFFKDYKRKIAQVDERWFLEYARKEGIDVKAMDQDELQWFDVLMWTFGWKAPNVGKYIMGRKVVNSGLPTDPQGYFFFNQEANRIECNPPEELQLLARKPNAMLSGLSIMLVFLIGWLFIHYAVGFIAALYLIPNWMLHQVNSTAGLDAASMFFSLLTILFAGLYVKVIYKTTDWKLVISLAVAFGISFALAVGSKLNSALIGFVAMFVFAGILYFLFQQKDESGEKHLQKKAKAVVKSVSQKTFMLRMLIISAVVIAFLTLKVFVYFNPMYKTDPIKKMKVVQKSVNDFFDIRARAGKTDYLKNSWSESFKLVAKRNFVNTMEDYNEIYGRNLYYTTIGNLLPFKNNPLDGLLIFAGFAVCIVLGVRQMRDEHRMNVLIFLAIYGAVSFYGNVDFIWVDFPRYQTPMFPFYAWMVGLTVVFVSAKFIEKVKPEWSISLKGEI